MQSEKRRYSEFASRIDIDAFETAIGFSPEREDNGNDIGFCPDPWNLHKHGDSTGKFAIHRDKRVYNCWVCGGGSLLSLTMAVMDLDEEDAIDFLYDLTAPAEQSNDEFMDEIEKILFVEKQEKPTLPWFNEHVLDKWMTGHNSEYVVLTDWCEERGISFEVAKEYKLGFDPNARRLSRSHGEYEGPGIIFPHFWGGRLMGWQTRWLDDDRPKWVPKYTNTHDFPRENSLFNYERVYLSPDPIVVVESVPTVLFLESIEIPAVATFGSNVTPEQIRLLRKCQQGVIIAPDNDAPGMKWTDFHPKKPDYIPLAAQLARYVSVKVAEKVPGEGADLGDLVEDPALAKAVVAAAEYYFTASL